VKQLRGTYAPIGILASTIAGTGYPSVTAQPVWSVFKKLSKFIAGILNDALIL
jgi:hypothetical protein